tara:strand:+ start:224 stop:757 length:534 start_codon:yes stop_codon:yes gene_type:complete
MKMNKQLFLVMVSIGFIIFQVKLVKDPILITENKEFNGKNKLFIWIGKGDCSQQEDMLPMFIMYDNSKLTNLNILNAPDGIHVYGNNVKINQMRNFNVCEDAISTKKYVNNLEINNSLFANCTDKAIQLNYGDNFRIFDNKFINCSQPIRIPKLSKDVFIENNLYHGTSKSYYLRSK